MNKRHHRKKAIALPKRQSLSVEPLLITVKANDGCSHDDIRENVKMLIHDAFKAAQ